MIRTKVWSPGHKQGSFKKRYKYFPKEKKLYNTLGACMMGKGVCMLDCKEEEQRNKFGNLKRGEK